MLDPAILRPATDAVLQTAPRAALRAAAAARVQRNGPSRLVARTVAQNSSVRRSSSAGGIGATVAEVPALLARKSSRPSASIAAATIFSAAPALDTSPGAPTAAKSEEHTSELQSQFHLVCRLLLEKKKNTQ